MNDKDKVLAMMQQAFDALASTTDSDIDDFESEEEEAAFAPVQYACRKIIEAMDILKSNATSSPAAKQSGGMNG